MSTLVEAHCPHCRTRLAVEVPEPYDTLKIVECDTDAGCGRSFVAEVSVSITITARRIGPATKWRASS